MTNAQSKLIVVPLPTSNVKGVYRDGFCYFNAEHNRVHVFKGLGLKWVAGGLAINGWWEYGGKKGHDYRKWGDSHAWLEDAEGKVYDFCQPSWATFCSIGGCNPAGLPLGVEFCGLSKDVLLEMGLEYSPADEKTIKKIQRLSLEYMYNPSREAPSPPPTSS